MAMAAVQSCAIAAAAAEQPAVDTEEAAGAVEHAAGEPPAEEAAAAKAQCPQGHALQRAKAAAGACDGCGRFVVAGEPVMDCRDCNWYLCTTCHPQSTGVVVGASAARP